MSKKVFVLIILLMSVSLIGIISVQFYWIKNTIQMSENQFTSEVKSALRQVSHKISERELDENLKRIGQFKLSRADIKFSEYKTFLYEQIDTVRNETFEYAQTILEENFRVPTDFFENDSIDFTKIYSKKEITIVKNQVSDNGDINEFIPVEKINETGELTQIEEAILKDEIKILVGRIPIHIRVSNKEINLNLRTEFEHRGINTKFKYGVYNDDLATKLKSGYFRKGEDKTYQVPLFVNDDGTSHYQLYVSFPDKKNYLIASIGKVLGLSALFILVIIFVFIGSLYQMIKQKQISEIKTDFINNMTHEFKTPIATINLALDAIKNPKVIDDKEKILRYSKMIRDENKRMHAQVENVLRISRLEKNQMDLIKVKQNMHDLIEEAVTHVDLLIQSKGGSIKLNSEAKLSEVLADSTHMINVVVNMLDNAIKYSPEEVKIEITTENTAKSFVVRIRDYGMGMNKNVQKSIFKKFYREERGNVHNVKGHGLGLAYVKRIVEQHQGTVQVESEKGKGSTFILNLPLI